MSLIDTSAWIEYLRDGDEATVAAVTSELRSGAAQTTEPVVMELLMGGRSPKHVEDIQALLGRADLIPVDSGDSVDAAQLYRTCRARGVTIGSSVDCPIAAVAIRSSIAIIHVDRDFEVLAHHTPLVTRSV